MHGVDVGDLGARLGALQGVAQLIDGCDIRFVAAVQKLILQKVDVNAPQPDGMTALHWAAYQDVNTRFARAMGHAEYDPTTPERKAATERLKERLRRQAPDLAEFWRTRGHHTEGRISIQSLRGRIQVRAEGRTFSLSAGMLLTLDRGVPHDVEAEEGRRRLAFEERALIVVYISEERNLPEPERRRVRRFQRAYVEAWTDLLRSLRADQSDDERRAYQSLLATSSNSVGVHDLVGA